MADTTESSTVQSVAQDIYYKMVSGALPSRVTYVDYATLDQPGFESDIAARFNNLPAGNDVVRGAINWMIEQNMVFFERSQEQGRTDKGSGGQPYPMRFECSVTVR